jgi:hypothetical protein
MLTAREKRMAQEVCVAFRQNVVGCDLLRTHDRTYVCDVNGWSFVKKRCVALMLLLLLLLLLLLPSCLRSACPWPRGF